MSPTSSRLSDFLETLQRRNPHQDEFVQAVSGVAEIVFPLLDENPDYREARILERLCEPDRTISFRVTWVDDDGHVQVNRAWRVQASNAVGPYKGGLRFHRSVNESILKFLAFEQTLKNSLTGLALGGAKGGADFDPRGRSDAEVMRFCQALMTELQHHIGPDVDVPAGDIGVGAREIGFLFGQYKRIANRFAGVITGKGLAFGGSPVRSEATGWGVAYYLAAVAEHGDIDLDGRVAAVSGSGNVALHAIEKLTSMGLKVVTASDSDGFVHDPDGIDDERLAWLRECKLERRGRVKEYADEFGVDFHEGERPWRIDGIDVALPCATQNELHEDDTKALVDGGALAVLEGANMPTTTGARRVLRDSDVVFVPDIAANAGGVAVSGLEQAQNATFRAWKHEEVDDALERIMGEIHDRCVAAGERPDGTVDHHRGAVIAGFRKVADAMLAYGAS